MAWGKSGTPNIDFGIAILALQNKIARIITGDIPIAGSSSGSGGSASWGDISGTLSAQTDLQTALDLKANTSALSGYATLAGTQTFTGVNTFTPPTSVLSTGTVSLFNVTPSVPLSRRKSNRNECF